MTQPVLPDDEGLSSAFAKAEVREPWLGAAQGFVPVAHRTAFCAWAALLSAMRECAFELSDPRVTAVKAGWWAEELNGVARGAARHPLTRYLRPLGGPWSALSAPLLEVASEVDPAADLAATLQRLAPLANAIIALECHLFPADAASPVPAAVSGHNALNTGDFDAQAKALSVHWLRQRLRQGASSEDRARIPLGLFARHGLRREQWSDVEGAALRKDWAHQLHQALPVKPLPTWPYLRRLTLEADRRALKKLASGAEESAVSISGFPALWMAWRAARNAVLQSRHSDVSHT